MSDTIDNLLQSRQSTHGDFHMSSDISQSLKDICENSQNWDILTGYQREAIHMICHKLARILVGYPHEVDHWNDMAGYSQLVSYLLDNTYHSKILEKSHE